MLCIAARGDLVIYVFPGNDRKDNGASGDDFIKWKVYHDTSRDHIISSS